MKKLFPELSSLISNTKVDISLTGWPAAAAVTSGCAAFVGGLYLLIKGGILQSLVSRDEDD